MIKENILVVISGIGGFVISMISLIRTIIINRKITRPNLVFTFTSDLQTESDKHFIEYSNEGISIFVEQIQFYAKKKLICVVVEKRFGSNSDGKIKLHYVDEAEPIMYHIWEQKCKEFTALVYTRGGKKYSFAVDVSGLYELQQLRHSIY